MRFVVDCSVTVPWFLSDEANNYADGVLDLLTEHEALVPSLWRWEFTNAILTASRRKRITAARRDEIIHQAERLPMIVDIHPVPLSKSATLAAEYGLTAYDAAYLELALRHGVALATQDRELLEAARRAAVTLIE